MSVGINVRIAVAGEGVCEAFRNLGRAIENTSKLMVGLGYEEETEDWRCGYCLTLNKAGTNQCGTPFIGCRASR